MLFNCRILADLLLTSSSDLTARSKFLRFLKIHIFPFWSPYFGREDGL
ncbi:Uncharacterised protein [Pandoraea pulmonicola]|uniref:Uncharacterized protein n=1 Tax=Pandoraea pulmonicola TaxID=93221 RepID=A0AAJ5D052_PANPU|nr:Uncharacterised protein [Pandoraea pulmonicola]